ncbi:MAG TPA: cyclodeaminase/cyclohydrolase family protein [Microbacterium sp.]|nr:cyclodeaminase/cyclohydrolase family protein [Microbacterium sp.]
MTEAASVPTSTPLDGWLTRLAQPDGDPGGGAASGVVLGLSAALMRMVAEYTDDSRAAQSAERLTNRRQEALDAAEADGARSAAFGAALALPAGDPQRETLVRDAAIDAARSSAALGAVGLDLLDELKSLAPVANPHLAADLAIAAETLATGIAGASINLRANLQIARKHDADPAAIRVLEDDADRLATARSEAASIASDVSARFDDGQE